MALMICPECGSKISDKADQCIHCGCPIEKNEEVMICKVNGKDYDFSGFYKRIMEVKEIENGKSFANNEDFMNASREIEKLTGIANGFSLCLQIAKEEKVPEIYNAKTMQQLQYERQLSRAREAQKVHCPYCKSTNVKKISFTGKALSVGTLGILSKKIGKQWHCNNCKSDF